MQVLKQVDDLSNPLEIPPEILTIRYHYQSEINHLKNLSIVASSQAEKGVLESRIRDKKIELDHYYYRIFHANRQAPDLFFRHHDIYIEEIQQQLHRDEMILEIVELFPDYRYEPDRFLVFGITKEEVAYHFIEGEEMFPALTKIYSLFSSAASSMNEIDSLGEFLTNRLLKPFESLLENRSDLIIIPSTHTWLIPFDALPMPGSLSPGIKTLLIEKFIMRKAYSLFSWLNTAHPAPKDEIGVLAIAPKFNKPLKEALSILTKRDTSLIDLPGSRKECLAISKIFPTKLVVGYDATEEKFDSLASHYQVIHLSTHGIPVEGKDQLLMLAFNIESDDTIRDGYLNLYEILNMKLDNELIVLSACKSDIGLENKSEGNLNLAWAFRNAGVSSVIVSLWDVNDYTSSVIMPAFYQYLSMGYPKPAALRQAKLDFISGHDELLSKPYYWAAFDYIGDNSPIINRGHSETNKILPFLILFLFIMVTGGYLIIKK